MEIYIIWNADFSSERPIGVFSSKDKAFTLAIKYLRTTAKYSKESDFSWKKDIASNDSGHIAEVIDDCNYVAAYWKRYTLNTIDE